MAITSALVLYAVIWFMTLLVMLPIGLRTQGDDNDVLPGTPAGAPSNYNPRKKAFQVTIIAAILWVIIAANIWAGWFDLDMIDWTKTLPEIAP